MHGCQVDWRSISFKNGTLRATLSFPLDYERQNRDLVTGSLMNVSSLGVVIKLNPGQKLHESSMYS